jgi:hypothetical protein
MGRGSCLWQKEKIMEAIEEHFWLFAVAGGALLLGAVLLFGMVMQKPLSPSLQARQDQQVRAFYGKDNTPHTGKSIDGSDQRKSRIGPLALALLFIALGCAVGYFAANQPTASSPSVEGTETQNTQPAGPADESALPGQQ